MKGILMFDGVNDLVFFKADEDCSKHLRKLAVKDGLLEEDSSCEANIYETTNKSAILQLFCPIIASYRFMQVQFSDRYKSIQSEDNVLLVFTELLNYVIIGIGTAEEGVSSIHRYISVFAVFVKMLYGPSLQLITDESVKTFYGLGRTEFLSHLIDTWCDLRNKQQAFLVEAVERLLINRTLTVTCVNLLQEVLQKIRTTHREGLYSHAFLLIDTKLLALYSSRNSIPLPKEEILLLTVIVEVFKQASMSNHKQKNSPKQEKVTAEDSQSDSEVEEEHVPVPATKQLEHTFSLSSSVSVSHCTSDMANNNVAPEENSVRPVNTSETNQPVIEKLGIQSVLVFLKSQCGYLVPYIMYSIAITKQITLIVLCERAEMSTLSWCLDFLIEMLYKLQSYPLPKLPPCSYETLDDVFTKMLEVFKKFKIPESKEKHLKHVLLQWENVIFSGVEEYLQSKEIKSVEPRLDIALSAACEALKNAFSEFITYPEFAWEEHTKSSEHLQVFYAVQKMAYKRLKDYFQYFEVKAKRNITMSSYIMEFPGLIHFIYIDRSSDYIIAPGVVLKEKHLSGTPSLKKKIWKMVSVAHQHVDCVSRMCCMWKEADLRYYYSIWFEDSTGKVIKPMKKIKNINLPPKGILCNNFYKILIENSFPSTCHDHVYCYEIFCVHLESTPVSRITEQSRRLSSLLWEFSGAYRTSLDLL